MSGMPIAGVVGGALLCLFCSGWVMFSVFWWLPRLKRWLERRLGVELRHGASGSWTIERGVGSARERHSAVKWLLLDLLVAGIELGFFLGMVLVLCGVLIGGWFLLRAVTAGG